MKILSIPNENGKMTCFWEEGASSGKKPLIICLADKEEDAQRDLNLLFSQANGASVAALVVYPQTEEQIVGDWLYSLRQREDVDENRITLTGTFPQRTGSGVLEAIFHSGSRELRGWRLWRSL